MALQKKVNKLQVEHVSEEEVDQVSRRARRCLYTLSRSRPMHSAPRVCVYVCVCGVGTTSARLKLGSQRLLCVAHADAAHSCCLIAHSVLPDCSSLLAVATAVLCLGGQGAAAGAGDAG